MLLGAPGITLGAFLLLVTRCHLCMSFRLLTDQHLRAASDAFNRREIYLDIVGFQPQSTQESLQLICSSLEAIDLYLQRPCVG